MRLVSILLLFSAYRCISCLNIIVWSIPSYGECFSIWLFVEIVFRSLHPAYKYYSYIFSCKVCLRNYSCCMAGQVVGVIAHGSWVGSEPDNMFHVTATSRPSARWLEETKASFESIKIAEVAFVRKTLAWITGIILLIATLLGVKFLLTDFMHNLLCSIKLS